MKIKARPEEYYVEAITAFFNKNGKWPRAQEIPSISKAVQRRYGGLVSFRQKHNLGYGNYTSGSYRSEQTKLINARGHKKESEVFSLLVEKHGRVNIHREFFFTDDSRHRADFCIFDGDKRILVDCFFSKDIYSLKNCLQLKINKYKNIDSHLLNYSVIYLSVNEEISSEEIKGVISRKEKALPQNQTVMTLSEFKDAQELSNLTQN